MRRVAAACCLTLTAACGPRTPEIQTVVSQVIEAQTASILSQIDWRDVSTQMSGKVGPNTRINAEGFIKHSAGFEVVITGGELEFGTLASGTGGRDNDIQAVMEVLTRWERADSLRASDTMALASEIASALSSRPSE